MIIFFCLLFKYYNISTKLLGMKLADLKITHATSGAVAFTLITATFITALNSNWAVEKLGEGAGYWGLGACMAFVGVSVVNQVHSFFFFTLTYT